MQDSSRAILLHLRSTMPTASSFNVDQQLRKYHWWFFPGQVVIPFEFLSRNEFTKCIKMLMNIESTSKATQTDDLTRIIATRVYTDIEIMVAKQRKRILHCNTNKKSMTRERSDGDVQNADFHEKSFDEVICTVSQGKDFLFPELKSTCMQTSNVWCTSHLSPGMVPFVAILPSAQRFLSTHELDD